MDLISATDDLVSLPWLQGADAQALIKAGYQTVAQLLDHLPRRYEDRRRFDSFPNQPTALAVCLRGTVVDTARRRFGGGSGYYEAVIMDQTGGVFGSGKITCRWFNMSFIHKLVAAGQDVVVYGKVKDAKNRLVIDQPEFEVIRDEAGDESASVHLDQIVPVYRNISGIPQRRLRETLYRLLQQLDGATVGAGIPGVPSVAADYQQVHFPESLESADQARRRFALQEFFGIQLNVAWRRAGYRKGRGRVLGKRTTLLKAFYESLPFDLTNAQKRSIREIVGDMREPHPMNRLLQGDVGAGKTFVAMAAMLLAVDSGCQAALMAPTQILAEQHFLTFKRWLQPLGVRISLHTGSRRETSHLEFDGEAQMLIGTHALLYEQERFEDLGLVVIDEQHKFGVAQRARLIRQGLVPDVLVMTATPIPRTLAMTIYGDLDVSLLDEKPAGRGKIVTALRVKPKQTEVTKFVREQLEQGRQAYLVYPLVEESESLKAESATEAHGKWCKRLPGMEVGMIHGKMSPEEKDQVMQRFSDGQIKALVATTVIEVGIDVSNATVMILHHAERFGLAQLHQLRGRVGRGEHKSYCVLLTDGKNPESLEKLKVLEDSSDGFVIAEADMQLRGPGNVLGTTQSGLADLRFVDFLADSKLLKEAREMADRVLAEDPDLDGPHKPLRNLIRQAEGPVDSPHGG